MNVIIDPSVLEQRSKINANPPTEAQLIQLCQAVGAVLNKRGVKVRTFRFCIDKIKRGEPMFEKLERRKDGTVRKKTQIVGGYRIRLLADGTPCVGWTMECDKFNIEALADEALDIADVVQLHIAGTWPYCDPDGDRREQLGLARELTERERRELARNYPD